MKWTESDETVWTDNVKTNKVVGSTIQLDRSTC